MLDLSNVQVALFDFDDTLCIHTQRPLHSIMSSEEFNCAVLKGEEPWPYGVASTTMQKFVALCHDKKIRLGLISAVGSFPESNAKVVWVSKYYGFHMENYCVGLGTSKVSMLKSVSKSLDISPRHILFVDDFYTNLNEAALTGFIACSPMECIYFMEHFEKWSSPTSI